MSVWQVDIEKFYQGEYWTNVYYVEADTLLDAAAIGDAIVPIEESITNPVITFTKYRTSDLTPGTDIYITTVINEPGESTQAMGTLLPLFNVVRVDLSSGVGRPGRKYLRGCMGEADMDYNTIVPASVTYFTDHYAVPLGALAGVVMKDGSDILTADVWPQIGMRQLRRGSKRKAVPII
jgi:hypothetical protein